MITRTVAVVAVLVGIACSWADDANRESYLKRLQDAPYDAQALEALRVGIKGESLESKKVKGLAIYCLGTRLCGQLDRSQAARAFLQAHYSDNPYTKATDLHRYLRECAGCGGVEFTKQPCLTCGGGRRCSQCTGIGSFPSAGSTRAPCPACKGSGNCARCQGEGFSKLECPKCNGVGRVLDQERMRATYVSLLRNDRDVQSVPQTSQTGQEAGPGPTTATTINATPSTVRVTCRVRTKSGELCNPEGWIQLLSTDLPHERLFSMIDSDESLIQSLSKLKEIEAMNARGASIGLDPMNTEVWVQGVFGAMGAAIGKMNMQVVAASVLADGAAMFVGVPSGDYIVYGTGRAGSSGLGYLDSTHLVAGSDKHIAPKVYVCEGNPTAAGWNMFGSGEHITTSSKWRENESAATDEAYKELEDANREGQRLEAQLRRLGVGDPSDEKSRDRALKRAVESVGLQW